MSINNNLTSLSLILNSTTSHTTVVNAKVEKFLKMKDADCIKTGIDREVIGYLMTILERAGGVWNFESFSRLNIEGTPEDLAKLCTLLTFPNFIFANEALIESILLKLHCSMASLAQKIQNDPTHDACKVFLKITHLLVLKLKEMKQITGENFILQCSENVNFIGQKEKLFCHFHQNSWHAHLFTEPTEIQSSEPLYFAPLNMSHTQGILFNKKGEPIQNSIYLLQARKLTAVDSSVAKVMILQSTKDLKPLSPKEAPTDQEQILEDIVNGHLNGLWHIDAFAYAPWDPNKPNLSNCLSFKSEYDPVTLSAISFRQDSLNLDEYLEFNLMDDAQLKIVESFSMFKEDFAKALELAPNSTQQVALELNLLHPSGFENEIDRLTDKELLQLQYEVLEHVAKEESMNPDSYSDVIVEIAQEQNVTIGGEVTPLSLANQMLSSIKEKIQVLEEQDPSPTLIAPELQQKDIHARKVIESKLSEANAVSIAKANKKKEKKKAYKERKKLEAQKKDSKTEIEDVKTTTPNNNNAPKLRNKDKELMSDIQSGKRVKGRVLFKLAMKMVDGVKNVKGSHFSTTVAQSDGSMEGTTIVKKHGGDSVVSSGSAKKTLKKLFSLRQKK